MPKTTGDFAVLSWMPHEISANQIKYLVEEEGFTEEEAIEHVYEDDDLFYYEWEFILDELDDLLEELCEGHCWYIFVENFGWRNLNGYNIINAPDAKTFLQKVLPNTDNHFHIFKGVFRKDKPVLRIQNYHHDSPCGNEWYTCIPLPVNHDFYID